VVNATLTVPVLFSAALFGEDRTGSWVVLPLVDTGFSFVILAESSGAGVVGKPNNQSVNQSINQSLIRSET